MALISLIKDQLAGAVGEWIPAGDTLETQGRRAVQVGAVSNSANFTAKVRIFGAIDTRFPELLLEFDVDQATPSNADETNFKWEYYRAVIVSTTGTATRASAVISI